VGRFVKGDVVVAPFPFSDLSAAKKRPALVVASLTGDDVILCQITSQTIADNYDDCPDCQCVMSRGYSKGILKNGENTQIPDGNRA
jgi:hypothetical protein